MDIDECFRKELIKRARADQELVKSLKEMSDAKERVVRSAQPDEATISVYVSLAYDSLREIMEAVCISNGYKVLSHACIGELLRKILEDFDYDGFDRMRYVRNSINYYGVKVELRQGKEIIRKIFAMKKDLAVML